VWPIIALRGLHNRLHIAAAPRNQDNDFFHTAVFGADNEKLNKANWGFIIKG
jgi:hypothetical protein